MQTEERERERDVMTTGKLSQIDPNSVLDAISAWSPIRTQTPPTVEPGSDLAEDASLSAKYQVGHAAWAGIVGAMDPLDAMRSLIADVGMVHTYAPFALIRAGLENAAVAVWLLGPDDRSVRLTRALHLSYENLRQDENAYQLIPRAPLRQPPAEEVKRAVVEPGESLGLDTGAITRRFGYEQVVRKAAEYAGGLPPDLTVYLWKVCSAHAHGRQWASLQTLRREVQDSGIEGVATVRFSTNAQQVLLVASAAVALNNKAMMLHESRRLPRGIGA